LLQEGSQITIILICVTWKADSVPVEKIVLALVFPVSVRKPEKKEKLK
jgi:hypothetical protein